jgi:hypothetical protein
MTERSHITSISGPTSAGAAPVLKRLRESVDEEE